MVPLKAVLFDFDGVIADSMDIHLNAWQFAHKDVYASDIDTDDLVIIRGKSTTWIAEFFCKKNHNFFQFQNLVEKKFNHLLRLSKHVQLLDGSLESFRLLQEKNIPFGIVSNSKVDFINAVISKHNMKPNFVLGRDNYKNPKPHPEPYLKGAKIAGVDYPDHKSIIVFEDSCHGIKAAATANMTVIGITTTHDDITLIGSGAAKTCCSLSEALDRRIITDSFLTTLNQT